MSLDRKLGQVVIRLFSPDEWELYRAVRLQALQSDSSAFRATYEEESLYPEQKWRDGLSSQYSAVFGVFYEGDVIGMTAAAVRQSDPTMASLWGSWLEKDWRGKGLSEKMYKTRIDWIKKHSSVQTVFVQHYEGNSASRKAILKCGFIFSCMKDEKRPDGKSDQQHVYELKI